MPSIRQDDVAPARTAGDVWLLARTSRLLAGSLDVDRLADRLLGVLVPDVVDWAQVTIAAGGGQHNVAWQSAGCADARRREWGPPPDVRHSVGGVFASGRRAVLRSLQAADLEVVAPPAAHDVIRPWLPCEALILPLAARGTIFGTLALGGPPGAGLATAERLATWEDLAARAALALDAARMYHEGRHALDVLQQDLHPPTLPEIPGLGLAAFYRPADAAARFGGDFYDVHGAALEWTVVLGDVAGKGVEAAVTAGRARQIMRTAAMVDRRPAAVLDLLNRVLVSSGEPFEETFVTVVCARLRRLDGECWSMELASGGHPTPMVLRASGGVEPIALSGTLVGLVPEVHHEEAVVELGPGDTVLLYTDGVTESRDTRSVQFGPGRVARLLGELPGAEPDAVVSHIARAALEWGASDTHDDVAILAVRLDPVAR